MADQNAPQSHAEPAHVDPKATPQAELAKPDNAPAKSEAKVKVKILKSVGPYVAGQVVEVSEEEAGHLTSTGEVNDGVSSVAHQRAMRLDAYEQLESDESDPNKMTMKQMADRNLINVVETPSEYASQDLRKASKAEELNLNGYPVAAGEPFVNTGGITPPTTVIPSLAKKAGRPTVSAEALLGGDKKQNASDTSKQADEQAEEQAKESQRLVDEEQAKAAKASKKK